MKDLIAHIAKALVDKPEEVVVTEIEGQQIYVIELKVANQGYWKNNRQTRPHGTGHKNDTRCRLR